MFFTPPLKNCHICEPICISERQNAFSFRGANPLTRGSSPDPRYRLALSARDEPPNFYDEVYTYEIRVRSSFIGANLYIAMPHLNFTRPDPNSYH